MTEPPQRALSPYERVVADIRARIASGSLAPGDRVPSTRDITREWGVAMATATKALAELRRQGLVEAVRGVGTVVRDITAPAPPATPAASDTPPTPTPTPAPAPRPREPRTRRPATRRRTPDSALTREAVVDTAIAVADAEGVQALSMRRVATDLGVSTMALYRHVASKKQLVALMIDRVYGELDLPDPAPEPWRAALELYASREWALYRNHPWAVSLTTVGGPVFAPGVMATTEWIMRVLVAQGRSPDAALEVITLLSAYTSGMALQATQAVVEEDELGVGVEDWWRSRVPELLEYGAAGDYPLIYGVSGPAHVDGIFDQGLERLLDGLAPLIEHGR
ncbi:MULTISPECIES: GntR family transcriptional regulator [unclassified Nocardiopsis]|uniref:GntR family transcriptional regulator n=1 Tax=Nocardiopsis TaxID=2013 RepID=UPI00387ABD1F